MKQTIPQAVIRRDIISDMVKNGRLQRTASFDFHTVELLMNYKL